MAFGKVGRKRRQTGTRKELFANVLIVTDGEQTETNYFNGLRNSFSVEQKQKIRISIVSKINTQDLIDVALEKTRDDPTFREVWIVFDRDNRKEDFDNIIQKARKKDIHVGWSNPCIEIFFHAYFGKMPSDDVSQSCIKGFAKDFQQHTGKEYKKNDSDIYNHLLSYGDEAKAIKLSKRKLQEAKDRAQIKKPSKYCPASTLHVLVESLINHRQG